MEFSKLFMGTKPRRPSVVDAQNSPKLEKMINAIRVFYPDFQCRVKPVSLYNWYYVYTYTNEYACRENNELDMPRLRTINAVIRNISFWLTDKQKKQLKEML